MPLTKSDLSYEQALETVLARVPRPVPEMVPLQNASGRVLAKSILAPLSLPPFDNSAMDGYALRAQDTSGASRNSSVRLRLLGVTAAGQRAETPVQPGGCVRVFTGSVLPPGANAVVMQEDTQATAAEVSVMAGVAPGENVRRAGEDVSSGSAIAESGCSLTPGLLMLLSSLGIARVPVWRRPSVAILATGSELREVAGPEGAPLMPGQIYDSNRLGMATLAQAAGAEPFVHPIIPDELEATRAALTRAFAEQDVIVCSGGVSVGELDLVKPALAAVGCTLDFWRISMKPGRPLAFGTLRGKPFFGLPGNPVSAFVTFRLMVWPVLRKWQGAAEEAPGFSNAVLGEAMENRGDRRHFLRVKVDAGGKVWSAGKQASHMLGSLSSANALLDLAPGQSLPAGATVRLMRL